MKISIDVTIFHYNFSSFNILNILCLVTNKKKLSNILINYPLGYFKFIFFPFDFLLLQVYDLIIYIIQNLYFSFKYRAAQF